MVLESALLEFSAWWPQAAASWALVVFFVFLAGVCLAGLIYTWEYGPLRAGELVVTGFLDGLRDLLRTSPRRVFALARLAVQEAIRKRAIAGLGVFIVVLAFALWFLDSNTLYDPAGLYLSFVLRAITYLSLLLGVLMSVFSLPNDLKNKTIYTIVTKPVRASEIVLGRIVGFAAIGSIQLALMGLVGYGFVIRALDHTHTLTEDDFRGETTGTVSKTRRGQTSRSLNHVHAVTQHADGLVTVDEKQGHWHSVSIEERDGKKIYTLGPPRDQFHARVPVYGALRFIDRTGQQSARGINVGNIWTYRSYIDGGTLAAGIWSFRGVTPDRFPQGLRVDLNIRIFRTHKGDLEKGVLGSLVVRNPRTGRTSAPRNFVAKEFVLDRQVIPRQLIDSSGETVDLFRDFAPDGEVEVQLSCLTRGQFFGMAEPDLYLLAREESVLLNYAKGVLGIWMQMVVVIAYGVMFSTFLNGPVSMLATLGVLLGGMFHKFILQVVSGDGQEDGPCTALLRIVSNISYATKIEPGLGKTLADQGDEIFRIVMGSVVRVLPNFDQLDTVNYVTYGFDIPWNPVVLMQMVICLGLLLPLVIVGFSCLRAREVAA